MGAFVQRHDSRASKKDAAIRDSPARIVTLFYQNQGLWSHIMVQEK
jgi:hypothetical protein